MARAVRGSKGIATSPIVTVTISGSVDEAELRRTLVLIGECLAERPGAVELGGGGSAASAAGGAAAGRVRRPQRAASVSVRRTGRRR